MIASRTSSSTARVVCRGSRTEVTFVLNGDDIAGSEGRWKIEVRDEAVLVAAVSDQLHAAMPLDEAGQPGLHVAAAATFAIGRADLRCEHLVE